MPASNGVLRGPSSAGSQNLDVPVKASKSESMLGGGSAYRLSGPLDWETRSSTGRFFKLIKQAHQQRAHQLLRLQNIQQQTQQLQTARDARYQAELDRQKKLEEKRTTFQQEVGLAAQQHEQELQRRRTQLACLRQEQEASARAAWEEKDKQNSLRAAAEARSLEQACARNRQARAEAEASRMQEKQDRIDAWNRQMRSKVCSKDSAMAERMASIEEQRRQVAARLATEAAEKAMHAQTVLQRAEEIRQHRQASVQDKWRSEEEHVEALQQLAEKLRLEKVAEAQKLRAIAEERIANVERSRAAAQDRTHERLQAKLERVNIMEDRRNALLQHLAALRRDISDLDAGIRAAQANPGITPMPDIPPDMANLTDPLALAASAYDLDALEASSRLLVAAPSRASLGMGAGQRSVSRPRAASPGSQRHGIRA